MLREQDPGKQALALRRYAARVEAVENELIALEAPLLEQHIAKIRSALALLVAAEAASALG